MMRLSSSNRGRGFDHDDRRTGGVDEADHPKGLESGYVSGTSPTTKKNTVILQSRPLFRGVMVASLKTGLDQPVVAYGSGREWIENAHASESDLIIFCSHNSLDVAKSELELVISHAGQTPVVVSSDNEDRDFIVEILRLGVRGCVPTSLTLEVWLEALRLVKAGGVFVPAGSFMAARNNTADNRTRPSSTRVALTSRQFDVIGALRRGKANKVIAYELNMRESTVKVHVRNIMRKLHAKNRTEVALMADDILSQNSTTH